MKPNIVPLPSSWVEFHREALDRALRQALGTSQPALRQEALDRAAAHLVHPRLVLESPLFADNHPWRREATAVSDAFEAVTNGMEEPGVYEALDQLEAGSPFLPWKHLILALHFFYEGLDEAVRAHLDKIPGSSPLQAPARVLESLVGSGDNRRLSPALRRLADLVAQPDPLVLQWVQDISEGLEGGHEDLFWAAFTDWLEAVAPARPHRARAAVLWAWGQLEWRDFDESVLLDLGTSLWGRAESCRLAALGTLSWDAEGAALLWLRFLVTALRDDEGTEANLRAARGFLDRFYAAASEEGFSPEGTQTWQNLALAWNAEVAPRGWSDLALGVGLVPPAIRPATDGQLDLFA